MPTSDPINSSIISYILQSRPQYSRFQIDLYLIQKGYSPQEIELAWQVVIHNFPPTAAGSSDLAFYKKMGVKHNYLYRLIIVVFVVMLLSLGAVLVASFASYGSSGGPPVNVAV